MIAIMAFLKELAQQTNIAIVCTIHQPSTAVFNGFDRVMLLSTGRVAYLGTSKDVLPYATKLDTRCAITNPAEFMLDLVNREFTDPKQVDYILDKYEKAYTGLPCGNYEDDLKETGGVGKNEHLGNSLFTETMALFRRHGLLVFRDPTLYVARAFMFLNACVFFGIIYIKSRERDQDQIFSRMWLLVWHIGVPTSLGVVAVYSYNEEFSAIKREIKNGMLRPFSYLFSNALIQIPLMLFLGMCAISVSGYGMADWYAPHYVSNLVGVRVDVVGVRSCRASLFHLLYESVDWYACLHELVVRWFPFQRYPHRREGRRLAVQSVYVREHHEVGIARDRILGIRRRDFQTMHRVRFVVLFQLCRNGVGHGGESSRVRSLGFHGQNVPIVLER